MNFFKKKKQDEPAPLSPSSAAPSRPIHRGPSATGLTISQRTTSTPSSQSSQPQVQHQSQSGHSSRNTANLDYQQQQQQQQYYSSQQSAQQGQQGQYLQHQHRDSDSISINSAILGSSQPLNQNLQQSGSYGTESVLMSQSIHLPYQGEMNHDMDDGYNRGYGSPEDEQQMQMQMQQQQQQQQYMANQQQQMSQGGNGQAQGQGQGQGQGQDNFYNGNGYDNSHNVMSSGILYLPGQGPNGPMNGNHDPNQNQNQSRDLSHLSSSLASVNLAANNDNGNGSIKGNTSNNNGSTSLTDLTISSDVRKLQDEVLSWKKSQETSHARVNQLRQTLTQKSQENRDLHSSLSLVTQERLKLQELVHKREKEMDDLRSKYLNDVRQIRATDDDHSTIEQRVRVLQAAILQLTKSSAGDRAVNLNVEEVQMMVKTKYKFGNSQPYILNMFLEKYIMDSLLEEVFHCPFYVGCSLGKQYGDIHQWMMDNNFGDQAVRFRQQMCFMSAKAPVAQAHAAEEAARIARDFEIKLERLYHNWNGHQKVLDLVTKAIELSLTMRSQNAEILAKVIPCEQEFDGETMVPAHKSKEGGKVKVCVLPCFMDTNGVVVGKAKVFCG